MTSRLALLLTLVLGSSTVMAEGVDYLRDVKPILAQKCFACHGTLKQASGLRLDAATKIRAGGDSGPAIVAGKPGESLLVERVSATDADMRMPPEGEGEPLDARQLGIIKAWIEQGAQAPEEPLPPDPREHWAYQPPIRPPVPRVSRTAWVRNPIDAFIGAAHEREGLAPSPPAETHVLLRRVSLDLIGLPPTVEELQEFLTACSPSPSPTLALAPSRTDGERGRAGERENAAYEALVDRLLASPRYGERWGRHWMDVWRYSDWAGYKQEVRESQRHIWRWRDWIIESINADKGYDRMVQEMLAGDELAPADPDVLRATGFLVRNRHSSNRNIWLDATVEHTAKAFLGLTINCARCHDHKYDPIPQLAYYQMRAIFEPHDVAIDRRPGQPDLLKDGLVRVFDGKPNEPTYRYIRGNEKQPDKDHPVAPGLPQVFSIPYEIEPVALPAEARFCAVRPEFRDEDLAAARKALASAAAELAQARNAAESSDADDAKRAAAALAEVRWKAAGAELEALEARWAADLAQAAGEDRKQRDKRAAAAAQAERRAAVAKAELAVGQGEQALAAARAANKPNDAKTKAALTKAEKDLTAARQNLDKAHQALDKTDGQYTPVAKPYPETSTGRRLALARWITRPDNPLAARVAVNHLWLRHFGAPLVENVFDFGLRSPRPPHADLLDWLAVELVESGWSMKHLHRLIVTSSTYRQSSNPEPSAEFGVRNEESQANAQAASTPHSALRTPHSIDPDNRWLWRMNSRRLEAELVRDGLLYVGGSLDLALGGPDIDQQLGESSRRRSIYFRHAYEKQMPFLVLFDAANVNECYRRSESIIPQQALAIANSPLSLSQSRLLARDLTERERPASDREFIEIAFARLLTRKPTADELVACESFLSEQRSRLADPARLTTFSGGQKAAVAPAADPPSRARESLVHVLLNHNDFVTIR